MSETKVQANSQGKLYISNGRLLSSSSGGSSGVIDSLNVTPTTSAQTITASGGVDGYSPINVSAVTNSIDSNIVAENIKDGVTILGVTGNYQGCDTIYLPNESGATINAGDKVLFTLGTNDSAGAETFTTVYKSSLPTYSPICILDNYSFIIAGRSDSSTYNGYLFTKVNNSWLQGSLNNIYTTVGANSVFQYFENGDIINNSYRNDYEGFITSVGRNKTIPGRDDCRYIGDYNGTSFLIYWYSGSIRVCTWDKAAGTYSQVLAITDFSSKDGLYRIFTDTSFGTRMIANNNKNYKIYTLSGTSTFTLLSQGNIGTDSNITFIGATGLATGDVVFAVDNYTYNYNAYAMASGTIPSASSHLFCYKMQSDGLLAYYGDTQLKLFENTPCYVAYDNRSNILSIGTKDEVYFYEFDTTNKAFNRISVFHTPLPTPTSNVPLRVQMTPDKSTFVVYGYSSSANPVYVYTNQESYQRIVPNSQYYYDLTTSFTGIATGETDEDDNYEISTVLPPIVDSKIITDLEPDEVIIKGNAE